MKKILTILMAILLTSNISFAIDKYSVEYLKGKNHFSLTTNLAEMSVKRYF